MLLKKSIDRSYERAWTGAKILYNEFQGLISLVFHLPTLVAMHLKAEQRCKLTRSLETGWIASDISEFFLPVLSDNSMTQHMMVGEQNNGKII